MKRKLFSFVLALMLVITLNPVKQTNAATNIPAGAKEFNGNYYFIYNQETTWEYAKKNCESVGGHLVTITSIDEQNFLDEFIGQSEKYFWMGANYTNYSTGEFEWVTGEKSSYTKWNDGEPKNSIYYDVLIYYKNGWGVGEDYESSQYICEWEMNDFSDSLPAKVILTSAKKASSTSVNITWKEVKDAEGYSVYMKTGSDEKYKKIADIDEADITTYNKSGLSKGTTYYFRVRAYKTIYEEKSYGELSATKKIKLK